MSKKKNTQQNKTFNVGKIAFVITISALVFCVCAIFVHLKQNFHIDEICSFGLANNQFQMIVEDFKEYSGKQLVEDYLVVHKGNEFDIVNVFYNQALDTHPPLWYILLHTICSIYVGTFSKWYGLIINCIFMIAVFWLMRHIVLKITEDKIVSFFIPFLSLFLNGFINSIVFNRMYIMLEAVSLSFLCLLIDKMLYIRNEKDNVHNLQIDNQDKRVSIIKKESFFILFFILTVIGTLTQYHYMIMALLISIVFGLFLIKKKEFKLLIKSIISGALGLVVSYLIFPSMINHIFLNTTGLHSLNRTEHQTEIASNLLTFLNLLRRAFFGNVVIFIVLVILILFLTVFIFIQNKINDKKIETEKEVKQNKKISDSKLIMLILVFIVIVYYFAICFTVSMRFNRYLFNIYPLISILIFTLIYFLLKKINKKTKYLTLLALVICIISSNLTLPSNLYYENKTLLNYMQELKDVKVVAAYYDGNDSSLVWKLPYPIYLIKESEKVVFVNINTDNWQDNEVLKNNDNLFLFIYTDTKGRTMDDNDIITKVARANNLENAEPLYSTSYIHLYLLY